MEGYINIYVTVKDLMMYRHDENKDLWGHAEKPDHDETFVNLLIPISNVLNTYRDGSIVAKSQKQIRKEKQDNKEYVIGTCRP